MKEKIRNIKMKIINKFNTFNSKQKLLVSIVFLIIMIFIVFLFRKIRMSENDLFKYNKEDGESAYISSSVLEDKDIYIQLKNISDNFINNINIASINNDYDVINQYYNSCLYALYKENISKGKFKSIVLNFYNKVTSQDNTIYENNLEGIYIYNDNFYIIRYYNDSEYSYLGVVLDESVGKYYIWYIE